MSARDVIVSLRMQAGQYIREADRAADATRRLRDQQGQVQKSGQAMGMSLKFGAIGLAGLGAAGGALKAVPPLLAAAATGAAVLPTVLGAAAADAIVLKAGLNGVGEAWGEVFKGPTKDPFSGLSDNATDLVAEAGRVRDSLRGVQQQFQERVTAGTAADLNMFVNGVLPNVTDGLNNLADDWSGFFREISAATLDPDVQESFNLVTASADRFFDQIIDQVQPAAGALADLTMAVDPVVRVIGDKMTGAIGSLTSKISEAKADGSLDAFFSNGAKSAEDLLSIGGDVVRIISQVVAETQKQSESLSEGAADLRAYMDSGRGAEDIAGTVRLLTTAAEGLKQAVAPLAQVLRDALADPGTTNAVENLFDAITIGTQTVQGLYGIFQLIPDGAQGVILAAIGVGVALVQFSALMDKAAAAGGRMNARLAATGAAGTIASRGLAVAGGAASKALTALIALQAVGAIFGNDFEVDSERLTKELERFAKTGDAAGEVATAFGTDLSDLGDSLKLVGDTGAWSDFQYGFRSMADNLGVGGVFDIGVANSEERIGSLDQSLTDLVKSGNAEAATTAFARIAAAAGEQGISVAELEALLPGYSAALGEVSTKGASAAQSSADAAMRTELLAGSFLEASLKGKDLAQTLDILNGKNISELQSQIALEAAYDTAAETVDKYGRATRQGTNDINLSSEAGQRSVSALIDVAEKAKAAAAAQETLDGNTIRATGTLEAARSRIVALATATTGSRVAAEALADRILSMPNKDVRITARTATAVKSIQDLGFQVEMLPDGTFKITAQTAAAKNNMAEAKRQLDALNGRTAVMQIRATTINMGGSNIGPAPKAKGGVTLHRAAQGLLQPEIAPPGTRYQWAEPETGGELFLPRRGINRERGRDLLGVAAEWYGGMFVPMARGGIRAAASGLVNVERAPVVDTPDRATRLDYAESYLRARDAVKSLSTSLKDNGRSFALSTVKGRENRQAIYAGIRAAQDAAKTKFEETGSVKQANQAYDEYLRRLRATLSQQKVSSATIRSLMRLAQRPVYDVASVAAKPLANSEKNVAYAKALIGAAGGLADLQDSLSLNKATASVGTAEGRENLGNILGFLDQAQAAAQARFAQTGSAKIATALYNGYVVQLRRALAANGYSKAQIDSLVNAYGRITLQRNADGGLYGPGGDPLLMGASSAGIYPGGRTLYGFAEESTGGEAFIPRNGDRRRGQELLDVAAGWYGGRFAPAGGAAAGNTTSYASSLTVNNNGEPLTVPKLQAAQRQSDVLLRTGRPK